MNLLLVKQIFIRVYPYQDLLSMNCKSSLNKSATKVDNTFATLWLKNSGDSLMLQRLLGHTTLMMTNRYCQAVGCYDAVEAHKQYSPVDNI